MKTTDEINRLLVRVEMESIHYRSSNKGKQFLIKAMQDAVHALNETTSTLDTQARFGNLCACGNPILRDGVCKECL